MRKAVLVWWSLLCACLLGGLHAQEVEADVATLPPAPADYLLDESRIFAREPQRREEITLALTRLADQHGFRFYFVLYDSLFGMDLSERAQRLKETWLGDGPGLVMVLETDSRNFRIGQNMAAFSSDGGLPVTGPLEITSLELSQIIDGMTDDLRNAPDQASYAALLATRFADGCGTILDQRAQKPEGDGRRNIILLAVGLGAGIGLLSLLFAAFMRHGEARSRQRFLFPEVHVGQRLGAPYGGGKVTSGSFGNPDRKA